MVIIKMNIQSYIIIKYILLFIKDKENLVLYCVDEFVWKLVFLYLVGGNVSGDIRQGRQFDKKVMKNSFELVILFFRILLYKCVCKDMKI